MTTNQFSYNVAVTNLAGNAQVSSNAVVTILQDLNGNGLPDDWEAAYGLSAALEDADGDGRSNLDEYLAGTNPTNPTDVLRLDCAPGGLRFDAQPSRTYSILASPSLDGPWATVLNVPAQAVRQTVYVPLPSVTNAFFRLQTP